MTITGASNRLCMNLVIMSIAVGRWVMAIGQTRVR
jgi:hypothetical protein